ncbi:hypothetical protein MHZ93_18280 [Roseomonas sp. ACRSG]|nr:hypothetical protein [Roseomonas sp. ACRSG]
MRSARLHPLVAEIRASDGITGIELRREVMALFLRVAVGGNSQAGYEKALEGR